MADYADKFEAVMKLPKEVLSTPHNQAVVVRALSAIRRARDDNGTIAERLAYARSAITAIGQVVTTAEVPADKTEALSGRRRMR